IYAPPGRYMLGTSNGTTGAIWVGHSNTLFRGEGMGVTEFLYSSGSPEHSLWTDSTGISVFNFYVFGRLMENISFRDFTLTDLNSTDSIGSSFPLGNGMNA